MRSSGIGGWLGEVLRAVNHLRGLRRKRRFPGPRPPPVAFLSLGRSGTTVIGLMLGGRPDCYWDSEPFHPLTYGRLDRWLLSSHRVRPESIGAAMRAARNCCYVASFKPWQLEEATTSVEAGLEGLVAQGIEHFVLFERQNLVRYRLSVDRATALGYWHLKAGQQAPNRPVALDLEPEGEPLVEHLEGLARQFEAVESWAADRRHLRLVYEHDILEDPGVAYDKVCRFVGLPERSVEVRLTRTNPFPVRNLIANLEEVERCLQGTRFAAMLDEG